MNMSSLNHICIFPLLALPASINWLGMAVHLVLTNCGQAVPLRVVKQVALLDQSHQPNRSVLSVFWSQIPVLLVSTDQAGQFHPAGTLFEH
jgi:hypothetical protein